MGFKKKGFTLAETLITLAIIGVVAAMAIPPVMQSTQDKEFRTTWKKIYSDFSQATTHILNENGGSLNGLYSTSDGFKATYMSYLSYAKECPAAQEHSPGCWHCHANNIDVCKYLNGNLMTGIWGSDSTLILNNGVSMVFWNNLGCAANCGTIYIDVNGSKLPNTIGRDMYRITVYENGIKPVGSGGTPSCPAGNGLDCSAKYLSE